MQRLLILLLKFVHRFWSGDLVVELILVCALVAANQSLLLNRAVLLLHVQEDSLVSHLLQVVHVLEFVQLIPIYLVVVVL